MTDLRPDDVMDADIELVTSFLNGQLDDARAAEVRQRLEKDEAFLEMAAPLIWAWSTINKPKARPPEEAEKAWEQFAKKAGFTHQRRKARRRMLRIVALVALAIGVPLYFARETIRETIADRRDFEAVPFDTGWIRLRNGALVRLEPGAELRAQKALRSGGVYQVKLRGAADFRIPTPASSGVALANLQPTSIETRAADVFTMAGDVSIRANGDTTTVDVPRRVRRTMADFSAMSTIVYVDNHTTSAPLRLNERERGRAIRGRSPEKLP